MRSNEETPSLLTRLLDAGADRDVAVVSGDVRVTYGELRAQVRSLASFLAAQGLRGGERVIVVLPNGEAFPAAICGVWSSGGVTVPLDARSPAEQIVRIARDCRASGIICDGLVFSKLEAHLRQLPALRFALVERLRPRSEALNVGLTPFEQAIAYDGPDPELALLPGSLASLMYTSGSTGRPKGVMHSHESLLSSAHFTRDFVGIERGDRVLIAFPMYHLFSFRVLLVHLLVGATVIAATDIFAGLKRAEETRPNALILVPAACALLVERFAPSLAKLSGMVRRISVGSAAISPVLLDELRRLLPEAEIFIPYGMTEARIGFLEARPGSPERRLCTVDPQLEVRVLDENGAPVEKGMGEVVLRGTGLMLGYWHNRDAENRELRREFRTRDVMEVREDGWYLAGRLDDVISVGGEKVFPVEVEGTLLAHPRIQDAWVVGQTDPRGVRGQVVKARVVLFPEATFDRDDILAHCRARLEPYKIPVELEPVASIPRNDMGKVTGIDRARDGGEVS